MSSELFSGCLELALFLSATIVRATVLFSLCGGPIKHKIGKERISFFSIMVYPIVWNDYDFMYGSWEYQKIVVNF